MTTTRLRFGLFELDPATGELTREGAVVRLPPQPARALTYLASRPGELVTREELQEYLWPSRYVEFDHGINTCIRQVRTVLGESAEAPVYIETFPRRGYRFIAPVERIGPDSLERPPRPRRRLLSAAAALAIVAAAGAVLLPERETDEPPTVAVLPFEDLRLSAERDAFSEALTSSVIYRLASLDARRLRIIGHTSSVRWAREGKPLRDIARDLGVTHVLEGTVRGTAPNRRVALQLIETQGQSAVWARELDERRAEFAAAEDIMAAEIAAVLSLNMAVRGGSVPSNPAARTEYRRARYLLDTKTLDALSESVERFGRAVDLDSMFAASWSGWGAALFWTGRRAEARHALQRALALDDLAAEAYLHLGTLVAVEERDWPRATTLYRRAVELAPGRADFYHTRAFFFAAQGLFEAAVADMDMARALDPWSPSVNGDAGWVYYWSGKYAAAVEHCERARSLVADPRELRPYRCLLHATERLGDRAAARTYALHILRVAGGPAAIETAVAGGTPREGLTHYHRWAARPENLAAAEGSSGPLAAARALAAIGDAEGALTQLQTAVAQPSLAVLALGVEPRFQLLASDPRFDDVLAELGLDARPQPDLR